MDGLMSFPIKHPTQMELDVDEDGTLGNEEDNQEAEKEVAPKRFRNTPSDRTSY
jgi:hypothetical protein